MLWLKMGLCQIFGPTSRSGWDRTVWRQAPIEMGRHATDVSSDQILSKVQSQRKLCSVAWLHDRIRIHARVISARAITSDYSLYSYTNKPLRGVAKGVVLGPQAKRKTILHVMTELFLWLIKRKMIFLTKTFQKIKLVYKVIWKI